MVKKLVMIAALGALAVGLSLFQPWRLWTSSEVNEALPTGAGVAVAEAEAPVASVDPSPDAESEPSPEPKPGPPPEPDPKPKPDPKPEPEPEPEPVPVPEPEPAEDRVLAAGNFVAAEHATSGAARILELADGRRFLRLEGFNTSDGPDLNVWITDQPSGGKWGSYDDGRYLDLGTLKATRGNQNYEIPPVADLSAMQSVVIWCDRFNVAFGSAPVRL